MPEVKRFHHESESSAKGEYIFDTCLVPSAKTAPIRNPNNLLQAVGAYPNSLAYQ